MNQPAPHALYDGLFRSSSAVAIFSEEQQLQSMLEVEAALAGAEAQLGLIPEAAVAPIRSCCNATLFDRDALAEGVARSGNLAIPLVGQLTKAVHAISPAAAGYVHWGATSQDVIDSGLVLQLRAMLELLHRQLASLSEQLVLLVERHHDTPMAGRTWLQQAVPITFGLKCAGWLDAVHRHQDRLDELTPRVLALQFGGAAGTLASLAENGLKVAEELAKRLGLGVPALPWHSQRDRVAEVATFLGLLMGSLGKMARDLALMGQTEIAEVAEPAGTGRGGSSTMPHKRNPVAAASILSSAIRIPGLVSTMLSAMQQEHERGLGGWHAEWETLPEICVLTSGALEQLTATLSGLQVFPQAMRANLDKTKGLLLAEAVSMALAEKTGKAQAHAWIERASHHAVDEGLDLRRVVARDAQIMSHLSEAELTRLFDPSAYMGSAAGFVRSVLAEQRRRSPSVTSPRKRPSEPATKSRCAPDSLHYRFDRVPGRPVLVLSNSLGTDLRMWDPQREAFSKHFSLLRYDSRGHGSSFLPEGPYTIEQMGQDLLGLLDTLALDKVYFCGLSMGGMVGQWMGAHATERLHKLVLSNTAAKIGTVEGWNERIAAVERGGMAAVVPAVLDRWFTPHFRSAHPEEIERTQQMLLDTSADGYTGSCAAVRDMDQRDSLRDIKVPTLVVYGTSDPVTPPAEAHFLAESIPSAQSMGLDAAHLSNVECRDEFTAGVLRFLLA